PPRPPLFPYTTLFRSRILVQRVIRGGAVGVGVDHAARAMIDGVRDQLRARAAFLKADPRQAREVQEAQENDDRTDDRRDAEDLRSEEHTSELQSPYDL